MRFLQVLLAITILMQTNIMSQAAEPGSKDMCHKIGNSEDAAIFEQGHERVSYSLSTGGKYWKKDYFSRHGSAHLTCVSCPTISRVGGGYVFLGLGDLHNLSHFGRIPFELDARVNSGPVINWSFKINDYFEENLSVVSKRDDIKLGPLSGFSILYKVNKPRQDWWRPLASEKFDPHVLLISAGDNCVRFETTIEMRFAPSGNKDILETLLSDVSISQSITTMPEESWK